MSKWQDTGGKEWYVRVFIVEHGAPERPATEEETGQFWDALVHAPKMFNSPESVSRLASMFRRSDDV